MKKDLKGQDLRTEGESNQKLMLKMGREGARFLASRGSVKFKVILILRRNGSGGRGGGI